LSYLTNYNILVTTIYIINFLVVLNLVFRERRSLYSTLGWILVLIILPPLGFILYLLFGRYLGKDKMFRLKSKEDNELDKYIFETETLLNQDYNLDNHTATNKDIISMFLKLNKFLYTKNNKVSIYTDGNEFFNELLQEIKKAKKFINIQFYIFKDDTIGKEIINALTDKLKEGVEVRLLYDSVGSSKLSMKSFNKYKRYGGKIEGFFPSFLKIFNLNINYRDHRKIVVIDGKTGFVGGFNVGDEYLGKNLKFGYWRDTHIKIQGNAVNSLNLRFIMDWRYASKEDIDFTKYIYNDHSKNGDVDIQIVSSGPDSLEYDEIKYGYLKMIQKAKDYIYIQSPYLILDSSLLDSLKIASLSGVDVRIMIPGKPDHPLVYWASYYYAGELLDFGVKVYTYDKNSFLHCKTIVIDDLLCSIGTANMDIRSFALNFEINAFMYSNDISIKQKQIFKNDMNKCTELTKELYAKRPTSIKIKESIGRLLSPIL
jgi:cardiolipin synthase A/B